MNREQTAQDKLLCDHLQDLVRQVARIGCDRFSAFLDERQQTLALQCLKNAPMREEVGSCLLFGGFGDAQRRMLGVFSAYCFLEAEQQWEQFPVQAVEFTYRREDSLAHRDFLGSILALGLKREQLGDILTQEGRAVVFCTETAAQTILRELDKVGRVGVKKQCFLPHELSALSLPQAFTLQPIGGTVSSLRLDCVVGLVTGFSREKSSALIKSGAVSVNFFESVRPAEILKEGDVLSIRGQGRFVVSHIGDLSKKGRIHLTCGKYV